MFKKSDRWVLICSHGGFGASDILLNTGTTDSKRTYQRAFMEQWETTAKHRNVG